MHAETSISKPRTHAIWRGPLVLLVFIALRLLLVPAVEPVLHPDSLVYLSEANQSWGDLFTAVAGGATWRPAGYPIFLKLLGATQSDDSAALRRVVLVQLILTSIAFATLAIIVSRRVCRTRFGCMAVLVLFALASLTIFAGPWDGAILSESLSLSCLLLICAAMMLAFTRPADPTSKRIEPGTDEDAVASTPTASTRPMRLSVMLWLLPLAACFLQLRDAHLPIVAGLVAILLARTVLGWRGWSGSSRAIIALWLITITGMAVGQSRAAIASGRADWPLTNVLSLRVWQSPDGFETFVRDYGLPGELRPLVGRFVWDGWRDQPEYGAWVVDRGRRSYLQFIISQPGYTWRQVQESFRFASENLSSNDLVRYFQFPDTAAPLRLHLASALSDLLTLPHRLIHTAAGYRFTWPILAVMVVLAGVILLRERQAGALYAGSFVVLMIMAQLLATFFLDACEDSRHNLLAYNALAILIWLPVIILADDIAARRESIT